MNGEKNVEWGSTLSAVPVQTTSDSGSPDVLSASGQDLCDVHESGSPSPRATASHMAPVLDSPHPRPPSEK